jgi:hypothetical protein
MGRLYQDQGASAYMTKCSPRTFTVFDTMMLVGATGCGFALYRHMRIDWMLRGPRGLLGLIVHVLAEMPLPFMIMWTVALLGLRLRQPRPALRRLARQPGLVACGAAMLALILEVAGIILGEIVVPPSSVIARTVPPYLRLSLPRAILHSIRGTILLQVNAGCAVAGALLILALSGRWRSEPSWLDRSGRALGYAWMIVNLFLHLMVLIRVP